ncbi:F-box protein PP2-B15 [Sesamum alatum]|uniref:F-box protein PP2-B15 n=1 Tax=Sesamum alatum TaxID=300844 RepID=A0AAE1YCK1_9LAMI|nr:F-box protein PP2-B15 [Sesamum alatum]
MAETRLEALPEDCLSGVISFTSPRDACRASLAAGIFRHAADSDLAWEKFLPADYRRIISKSVAPVEFSSMKELFGKLSSTPLLIDGGKKTFSIEKYTNKICYMLSARELSITWSTNPLSWCWKPLHQSRFPEAVELIMVCWLEIRGKINTKMLSPNTTYGAYLVIQLGNRAFGLGAMPLEGEERVIRARDDGWLEVELGEFYNDGSEKEVIMEFKEVKGEQLKGGLVVEGIELRPKN